MNVLTEHETLDALLAGRSIARFGDGEFKIARGGRIKSQCEHPGLTARLRDILAYRGTDYLVGIPRVDPKSPKYEFWEPFMEDSRQSKFLDESYQYGSSLISRPDSAPWIDNDDYWQKVISLWKDRHVCLIWGGSRKSITPGMLVGAGKLDIIETLGRDAWREVPTILAQFDALQPQPELVVLVVGPTSTGLIPDFVNRGVQAVDLGHIGAWLRPQFKGTKEFKAAHGFVWPGGAEEYGQRYVRRTQHLEQTLRLTPKRRTCVQAGGHVGVWPKYLSAFFENVYTFEPDHMNFLALCRNCPEKNVFRFQAALGNQLGCVNLVIHPNNIGGHHVKGEGAIPTLRIDDLGLKNVDLIQLDIEGSEFDAVIGAKHTIQEYRPTLHLELKGHIEKYNRGTTDGLKQLLESWDYQVAKQVGDDTIYTYRRSGGA